MNTLLLVLLAAALVGWYFDHRSQHRLLMRLHRERADTVSRLECLREASRRAIERIYLEVAGDA